jgi:hypothetical protein
MTSSATSITHLRRGCKKQGCKRHSAATGVRRVACSQAADKNEKNDTGYLGPSWLSRLCEALLRCCRGLSALCEALTRGASSSRRPRTAIFGQRYFGCQGSNASHNADRPQQSQVNASHNADARQRADARANIDYARAKRTDNQSARDTNDMRMRVCERPAPAMNRGGPLVL